MATSPESESKVTMADYQKVVDAANVIENELASTQDSEPVALARGAFQVGQLLLTLVPEVQQVQGFEYAKEKRDEQVKELQQEIDDLRKQLEAAQNTQNLPPSPGPAV